MHALSRFLTLSGTTLAILSLTASFSGCASKGTGGGDDFVTKVKPVLEYYCIECHSAASAGNYGGLNIETGKAAMTTGRHAPVIRAGDPEGSLFFKVLRFGHEDPLAMPPAPDKVSDAQLAAVRDWIRDGAIWPEGPEGRLKLPQ